MTDIVLYPRNESLGFLIYRTSVLLKSGLRRAFQTNGLDVTPEQWSVLSSLKEQEGVHQSLLAERTEKDRHNITRILDLLEKHDLIRREADQNDKRRRLIRLTETGKALELELNPIAGDFLRRAFQGLSNRDLSALTRILDRVTSNLHGTAKDLGG